MKGNGFIANNLFYENLEKMLQIYRYHKII